MAVWLNRLVVLLPLALVACGGGGVAEPIPGVESVTPPAPNSGSGSGTESEAESGSTPSAVLVKSVAVDAARIPFGKPVALDLRGAAALATLPRAATRYQGTVTPADAGLTLTEGVLRGTPQRLGVVEVVIEATPAGGATVRQPVRVVVQRTSTEGAPVLPAVPIDYLSEPLPAYFTDPNGPVARSDNTPDDNPATNAGITLGRVLFHDTRLSVDGTVSCASCHVPQLGYSDPERLSPGVRAGEVTGRHSMALANVRYYGTGRMFWDERAASLEGQAIEPILNPVEMGNRSLSAVARRLSALPFYADLFQAAFGRPDIDGLQIGRALAQYQRALISWRSRYDTAQASGQLSDTFTRQELHGLALFGEVDAAVLAAAGLPPVQSLGCVTCHQTDAQIGRLGNADDREDATGPANIGLPTLAAEDADPGAGNGRFKTPSLRNIARTAPYMHDGRFDTLEQVVRFFASGVEDSPAVSRFLRENNEDGAPIRRRTLTQEEVDAVVAYLRTLTDEAQLSDPRFADPFAAPSAEPLSGTPSPVR